MNDRTKLSQLPEDDAYWQALEVRIVASLGRPVEGSEAATLPWAALTDHALELAGLAVAAAVATVFFAPSPASSTAGPAPSAGLLTPPSNEMALVASLNAESPPALGDLVLPVTVNQEEGSR